MTCRGPRDIEYHPLRDEIWVRCMGTNSEEVHDETETYIDVFSVTSPGVDTVANVLLTSNSTLSAYGYSVIENNLGDVGYSTVSNQNKLYKIDLSEKKVLSTCGFVGADNEDCGRYGSSDVTITTGPFA